MSDDVKAWLVIATIFGFVMLFAVGRTSPSRADDPDGFYQSKGYSCESDCSGHDAGYEWARDNHVCDENFTGGNSESFAEGVRAYAKSDCDTGDPGDYRAPL